MAVVYGRSDAAAFNANMHLRFNNDAGSNYYAQKAHVVTTTFTGVETLAQSSLAAAQMPAASASGSLFGPALILIPNYATGLGHKGLVYLTGLQWGTATATMRAFFGYGCWIQTTPINRITFFPDSGNYVAGSRFTLYGMGGLV